LTSTKVQSEGKKASVTMQIDTDIKLLKYRRTKIMATLGPSSSESWIIDRLIAAGVNVFRLNMSHGTRDTHRETYARIRSAADRLEKPVAVLVDLSGPKIRVGTFIGGSIELTEGASITITTRDVEGGPGLIPSQYKELSEDVVPDDRILLDDGNLELRVVSVDKGEIVCTVISGGILSNHKGMNLPGVKLSTPSLTDQDRSDAYFAMELGVDFIALSFVRRSSDVNELRALVSESGSHVAIVSKIEKPEALENISEILSVSDAIMIARGDLGVELPPEAVPIAQNQLIDIARDFRKPVIVATQMLESMIQNQRPTRAEVSDVSNAVRSGADAVMLSAETAVGRYPIKAVEMMDKIVRQIEGYQWRQGAFGSFPKGRHTLRPIPVEDALAESTSQLSRDLLVRAVVAISMSGHSVAVMSSSRPAAPIVGVCPDPKASRIGSILWGVIPIVADLPDLEDPQNLARRLVRKLGLATENQSILLVGGFSSDPKQNSPSVTVVPV
jgi:pyruvate kinase